MVVGNLGSFTKIVRKDEMKPILEYKADLLTTSNYRNLINTHIQDQIFQMQNQIHLQQNRKINLKPVKKDILKFDYKGALNKSLKEENPIVTLSLIQELKNRNELYNSLESRNDETLMPILKFIIKYIRDNRYTSMLIDLSNAVLDIYSSVVGLSDEVDRLFRIIRKLTIEEINLQKDLMSLKGSIDTLMLASSLKK
jgi:U3 small nucleolar RNA-associated protein 15